jgi:hypothetical protein
MTAMMLKHETTVYQVIGAGLSGMLDSAFNNNQIQPALQAVNTSLVIFFLENSTDVEGAVKSFKDNLDMCLAVEQKKFLNRTDG